MIGFEVPQEIGLQLGCGGEALHLVDVSVGVHCSLLTFHRNNQCSFFFNVIFTLDEVLSWKKSNNRILTELFSSGFF
jgi:hypothetical protein